MRYLEYLYLLIAVGLVAFMAIDYKELSSGNVVTMMVGIAICSFMFSFRRKQRMVMEAEDKRRMEASEDEDKENGA